MVIAALLSWMRNHLKEMIGQRNGLGEADSNLVFAVTSNTKTKGHNLELINKHKTKQHDSSGRAVNQQELAAKVTDELWRM